MTAVGGRRTEIGLGAASSVSLACARRTAERMREAVATGEDPRAVLKPDPDNRDQSEPGPPLFGDFADELIKSIEGGFKNEVHRAQWKSTLRDHAASLRPKRVDTISTEDVLEVLRPLWAVKFETASRLRGRIERVLDAAAAMGYRDPDRRNPATWKGHLEHFLARRPKRSLQKHHEAMRWQEAPSFMAMLRSRPDSASSLALQFTVLTAARTGEVIGATLDEFDFDARIWTVPAERTKTAAVHAVPLSHAALEIARRAAEGKRPQDRLFPLSNMAMLTFLQKRLERKETVHGFRSTFRDWLGEETPHPRELCELALGHSVGNAVEQAYRRGRAIEKRRPMMEEWAAHLGYALGETGQIENNAPPAATPMRAAA